MIMLVQGQRISSFKWLLLCRICIFSPTVIIIIVFIFEPQFPSLLSIYHFFQVRSNGIALPVSWGLAPPLKIMGAKQKESCN